MNVNDVVTIMVKTMYGTVEVDFTIIADLGNYHYALIAQDKICVGQQKATGCWILSEGMDLHDIKPVSGLYHDQKEITKPERTGYCYYKEHDMCGCM